MNVEFTKTLLNWHRDENKRIMPWKEEKNPYRIWISEIILQQTRVEQGILYYNKFIDTFPTIEALALAQDDQVFKIWEGLGYYSRCKNLLFTARQLFFTNHGVFPKQFSEIIRLKGVGQYTAAAIASFAYGLPHAVVDGNVFRILSRYFGHQIPIDTSKGKAFFTALAQNLLCRQDPSAYNQAIMDFGATVCKPKKPECIICPLQKECIAFREKLIAQLPVKQKRIVKKKRWFNYFIFEVDERILIKKRTEKGIWQNLHEFYLFEAEENMTWTEMTVRQWLFTHLNIINPSGISISSIFTQQLTHQTIAGTFVKANLTSVPLSLKSFIVADKKNMYNYSFPKFINAYLETQNEV